MDERAVVSLFSYVKGDGCYMSFPSKAFSEFVKDNKSTALTLPSMRKQPIEYEKNGKRIAYQFFVPEKEIRLWVTTLKPFFKIIPS